MERRKFLKIAGSSGFALGLSGYLPAWGRQTSPLVRAFHFDWITDVHSVTDSDQSNAGNFEHYLMPSLAKDIGDFLIITGDLDTFALTNSVIQRKLVTPAQNNGKEYTWYPIMGNHDGNGTSTRSWAQNDNGANLSAQWNWCKNNLKNMNWSPQMKSHDVGYGPDSEGTKYTTYSWDWENCHFISLNLYADETGNANILEYQMEWLKADLDAASGKEHVFIGGHQPATGGGSLIGASGGGQWLWNHKAVPVNSLWPVLKQYPNVRAYLYGHHHKYLAENYDGIWHIQGGQGRGDSPAINHYTRIYVDGGNVTAKTYTGDNVLIGTVDISKGDAVSTRKNRFVSQKSRDFRVVHLNNGLEINVSLSGQHRLEIIDAHGVVRKTINRKKGYRYFIPNGTLPHGMYVIRLEGVAGVFSDVVQILK